jgi:hypothetical protein
MEDNCIPSRGENPFIKILHNYQYDFVYENIRNVKAINDLILSHAAVSTSLLRAVFYLATSFVAECFHV